MHHVVRRARYHVFLGERLHRVGDRLKHAKRSHAIRPVPVLHPPQTLALENRRQGEQRRKNDDDRRNFNHDRHQRLQRRGCVEHDPVLQRDEDLIDRARGDHSCTAVAGFAAAEAPFPDASPGAGLAV